jgi:succinate dehydrogenase / fumarate reductase membrane anchor subunit
MSMRSELGRVRGLGSARQGAARWWAQRVTAIALAPLSLWLVISLMPIAGGKHADVVAWIRSPVHAVLLVLVLLTGFGHAELGLRVVIEDYVRRLGVKVASLVMTRLVLVTLATACVMAVVKIALRE